MKLYELIIAINPSLSTEDSNDLIAKVEGLFPDGIKQKDDMGYQTIYNVNGLKPGAKAYFVSYLLETDPQSLPGVKQKMSLFKGLLRSLFIGASAKIPFVNFHDINSTYVEKLAVLATKDKKAKKTKDQKQQLLDTAKEVEIEIQEEGEENANTNEDMNANTL
jgi:ribosomal protein S6